MFDKSIYLVMFCFLLCVSTYTVITKYQSLTPGLDGKLFSHPYWQTFVCSLGESCALLVYLATRRRKTEKLSPSNYLPLVKEDYINKSDSSLLVAPERPPEPFNRLKLALPAFFLNSETVCKCIATLLIPASTV